MRKSNATKRRQRDNVRRVRHQIKDTVRKFLSGGCSAGRLGTFVDHRGKIIDDNNRIRKGFLTT